MNAAETSVRHDQEDIAGARIGCGAGDDVIDGGSGDDVIKGGSDNDTITALQPMLTVMVRLS